MAQDTIQQGQTEEIARERWSPFLAAFTRENRGAHAALEVVGGEIGRVVEVEDRPFDGIAADVKDGEDAVWIHFGSGPDDRISHAIDRVSVIRVRTPTGYSGAAVEVESADGTKTLLELSRPQDYELPPAEQGDRKELKG